MAPNGLIGRFRRRMEERVTIAQQKNGEIVDNDHSIDRDSHETFFDHGARPVSSSDRVVRRHGFRGRQDCGREEH
jgi:hypothetical protein